MWALVNIVSIGEHSEASRVVVSPANRCMETRLYSLVWFWKYYTKTSSLILQSVCLTLWERRKTRKAWSLYQYLNFIKYPCDKRQFYMDKIKFHWKMFESKALPNILYLLQNLGHTGLFTACYQCKKDWTKQLNMKRNLRTGSRIILLK